MTVRSRFRNIQKWISRNSVSKVWSERLLIVLGLITGALGAFVLGNDVISAFVLAVFVVCVGVLGASFLSGLIPWALRVHRALGRLFQATIVLELEGTKSLLAQIAVSLLLNLTYWTLLVFLPFTYLADVIPLLRIVETFLPGNFDSLLANAWFFVGLLLFAGSGGPATIFWMRHLRKDEPNAGMTTLTVLHYTCYASWIVILLSTHSLKFKQLEIYFLLFALPATFVNLSFMTFIERRRALRYIE